MLPRIIHNGLLLLYATDTLHDIVNVTGSKDWKLSCFKLTKEVFGEVVGALYVQQYTPQYLETLANRVRECEKLICTTMLYYLSLESCLRNFSRRKERNSLSRIFPFPSIENAIETNCIGAVNRWGGCSSA